MKTIDYKEHQKIKWAHRLERTSPILAFDNSLEDRVFAYSLQNALMFSILVFGGGIFAVSTSFIATGWGAFLIVTGIFIGALSLSGVISISEDRDNEGSLLKNKIEKAAKDSLEKKGEIELSSYISTYQPKPSYPYSLYGYLDDVFPEDWDASKRHEYRMKERAERLKREQEKKEEHDKHYLATLSPRQLKWIKKTYEKEVQKLIFEQKEGRKIAEDTVSKNTSYLNGVVNKQGMRSAKYHLDALDEIANGKEAKDIPLTENERLEKEFEKL